jgi:hypothetical protein
VTGPAEPHKVYLGLRGQLLSSAPASFGLGPTADLPHVWAVLMDLAVREHHATVVGVADGTTSLYTSVGGGMLGAGELPAVREAASRLLHVAERELDEVPHADAAPLPAPGHVAFVVLGHDGMRRVEVPERDAMTLPGVARELYMAAQAVVTQLRLADRKPA